jgi:hypothetical protein
MPSSVTEFIDVVNSMDFNVGARTAYQDFLTPAMNSREKVSRWLSEGHYQDTLNSLRSGSLWEIPSAVGFSWS